MDCSLPGFSVHGVFQARILEWVAIPFSRGSSWPRDQTQVSCTAGRLFTDWATREARSRIYIHKIFSVVPKSIMYIVSSRIIYWVLFLGLALSRMRLENFKILLVHNFWIQVPCSWVCEAAHRWMALAQLGKCCDKFIYKCHSNSHTHTGYLYHSRASQEKNAM